MNIQINEIQGAVLENNRARGNKIEEIRAFLTPLNENIPHLTGRLHTVEGTLEQISRDIALL